MEGNSAPPMQGDPFAPRVSPPQAVPIGQQQQGMNYQMMMPPELQVDQEKMKNLTADEQQAVLQEMYNEQARYQERMAEQQFADAEKEMKLYQKQMEENARISHATELSNLSQQIAEIKQQKEETMKRQQIMEAEAAAAAAHQGGGWNAQRAQGGGAGHSGALPSATPQQAGFPDPSRMSVSSFGGGNAGPRAYAPGSPPQAAKFSLPATAAPTPAPTTYATTPGGGYGGVPPSVGGHGASSGALASAGSPMAFSSSSAYPRGRQV